MLKDCSIKDKINLEIQEGKIIITPVNNPRENWYEEFKLMHANGDDKLIIDDVLDVNTEILLVKSIIKEMLVEQIFTRKTDSWFPHSNRHTLSGMPIYINFQPVQIYFLSNLYTFFNIFL